MVVRSGEDVGASPRGRLKRSVYQSSCMRLDLCHADGNVSLRAAVQLSSSCAETGRYHLGVQGRWLRIDRRVVMDGDPPERVALPQDPIPDPGLEQIIH
jgi:hypothetical protein